MNDNRQIAINSLLNLTSNHKKLSDGTYIGIELYDDLKKIVLLELKKKYKINDYKLIKINIADENNSPYDIIELKDDEELFKAINDAIGGENSGDNILNINPKYKLGYLKSDFNTVYKYNDGNNIGYAGGYVGGGVQYYKPEIELNTNPKELAIIINDLKELEKIFMFDNYSSLDDMVKLDFYRELIRNIEKIKKIFKETDIDITKEIIDNLKKKIKSLYGLNEPTKDKDKEFFNNKFKEFLDEKIKKYKLLKGGKKNIYGGDKDDEYDENIIKNLKNILNKLNNIENDKSKKKNINSEPMDNLNRVLKKKFDIEDLKNNADYLSLYYFLLDNDKKKGRRENVDINTNNEGKKKDTNTESPEQVINGGSIMGGALENYKLQKNNDKNDDSSISIFDIYINIEKIFKDISLIYHNVKEKDLKEHTDLINFLNDDEYTGGDIKNYIDEKNEFTGIKEKLEKRRKLLQEKLIIIKNKLKELYLNIISLKKIPQITEYEDEIKSILKTHHIQQFENDDDTINNNPIINEFIVDIDNVDKNIAKYKEKINGLVSLIDIESKKYNSKYQQQQSYTRDESKSIPNNNEYGDYTVPGYNELYNLIRNDYNNNLYNLVKSLKESLVNNDYNKDNNNDNLYDINNKDKNNIFSTIWRNYTKGLIPGKKSDIPIQDFTFLEKGERLYNDVIMNKLVPEDILEINLQDKAIYLFLIFLLRTAIIIVLDIFIEYNLIKTLHFAILLYGFLYIIVIIFLILLVNYDSYKLRILFNYLNLHINYSNIFMQNFMFIIFLMLIFIMVKNKDFLKYFGNIFDFTNIYNNIYELSESLNNKSDINLTKNEKLKLLYQIDIISMIIFIFNGIIVLIL